MMIQLPKDFIEKTRPVLGDEWDDFVAALADTPPTSIRLNSNKTDRQLDLEKVKWCSDAYYLPHRPQFTFDPLLHAGVYYVQEASSMFIEHALKELIHGTVKCLDLCAAPGGKSTVVSNYISKESLLVSNEIVRSRAYILSENLMKWGNANNIVTNNKPDDFTGLKNFFDLILVDAPCSGEGMFRKDPQAIDEWSVANVNLCAERQKEIISSVWSALKPGGYLFYSTCTYNREENEDIVHWVSETYDADVVGVPVDADWQIAISMVKGKPTYHFYPHKTKGEGFYFAVLHKKGEMPNVEAPKKDKKNTKKHNITFEYKVCLRGSDNYIFLDENGVVYAFPSQIKDDLFFLKKHLNFVHKGVNMGEMKGKSFIPHQSLALSNEADIDTFTTCDVDWATAVSFLRKEALMLDDAPRGLLLLRYKGRSLGFVKNLGNRANNLYANEWRIRTPNQPTEGIVGLPID